MQTDKGTEVDANLVIVCNGIKINSAAYRTFGKWEAGAEGPSAGYFLSPALGKVLQDCLRNRATTPTLSFNSLHLVSSGMVTSHFKFGSTPASFPLS